MEFFYIASVALIIVLAVGLTVYLITSHKQMVQKLSEMDQRQRDDTEKFRNALDSGFAIGRTEAAAQRKESQKVIQDVHEKLGAISKFKETVDALNENVSGVRRVFENPKKRGLFGESQLKDIVTTALPAEMYEFEYSVTKNEGNSVKFDCFLKLPDPPGPVGIDSKFPAELYQHIVDAKTETAQSDARKHFGDSIKSLIKDIASKYIIPNVTSEFALMFVPSEAIFAEIYSSLEDVTKESQEFRVYLVSPSTLMAALNTIRSVVNTMEVQRAAKEVIIGLTSFGTEATRLAERAQKLEKNIITASKAAHSMVVTSDKINQKVKKLKEGNTELITGTPSIQDSLGNGELPESL